MRIAVSKPLFAWDCLDDSPTLSCIRQFLEVVPDADLLEGLRKHRAKGRDDYPVRVLWGVLLLSIFLRHPSIESCLAELRRNEPLRLLLNIEREERVPKPWNMSRFLDLLGQEPHQSRLRSVFDVMVQQLGEVVVDLGRHTAGDSAALNARHLRKDRPLEQADAATASTDAAPTATSLPLTEAQPPSSDQAKDSPKEAKIEHDEHGLPQPSGGRKEYKDDAGNVTKVVSWYGYKFHLLVDVRHEVVLAYRVTSTKAGDNELIPALVEQAQANLPARRIETMAYDKAADDEKVHEFLQEAGIKPVIQNRALWKEEHERMLPGHDGMSNVVYDEAGTVFCYDKVSEPPVQHRMSYIGHEAERGTLKYRCPAMHEGWDCPMAALCNAGKTYGKTVRVKQDIDLRRFPPIPRATKQFERLYKGRTAVERINARMKIYWGADDGNSTGATRFHALMGTIMVVHLGVASLLASTPRREGTLGKMNLSPVAKALKEKFVPRHAPVPVPS